MKTRGLVKTAIKVDAKKTLSLFQAMLFPEPRPPGRRQGLNHLLIRRKDVAALYDVKARKGENQALSEITKKERKGRGMRLGQEKMRRGRRKQSRKIKERTGSKRKKKETK